MRSFFFFRCDKNGDGKLSEEEVKEVRTETQKCSFSLLVYSSSSSSSCSLILNQNSEIFLEKVIVLSASANKLANLKQQAASYAALIMEELDPDHLGYIEVNTELLLRYTFFNL